MRTRGARTVRGLVVAFGAVFVAVFFHSVADGCPPSLIGVVVALLFAIPVCVLLAGKTLSRVRLAFSVASSQAVFHVTMSMGNFTADAITSDSEGLSHHAHAAATTLFSLGAGSATDHTGDDSGMWLAHLFAAALTFFALRRGEATFWVLLTRTGLTVAAALFAVTEILPSAPSRSTAVSSSCGWVQARLVVLGAMRHRGPPFVWA
ncbi:hypothetical protein PA27867_3937 (plasmid) [Cryobacterium arcticum]|uniref:Uncharacterized protein n=1 Tax=Cryobacterium arcticum TaxID=670052 RepID=A0A1B1BQL1_9MICO|nr:hypothetical protein PA27867_3937 [Cryobacterium arcticum]